jgi:branched-chain amino acid transport system permease protein
VAGLLLGGLYAALGVGFTLAFGLIGVANIAHPVIAVLGAYGTLLLWRTGVDPILAGLLWAPVFFAAGWWLYRVYRSLFELRGAPALNAMTFFFGLMFVVEVGILLAFGVDYQVISSRSTSGVLSIFGLEVPYRLLSPFLVSLLVIGALVVYLRTTYTGWAISAVAQDEVAVRIVGAKPARLKAMAFGLATASAAVAGSLLLVVTPVQPATGRELIGRMFAVTVLGGITSVRGTLLAGVILGIAESLVQAYAGGSWSTATGFVILLGALALRPQGMFRS